MRMFKSRLAIVGALFCIGVISIFVSCFGWEEGIIGFGICLLAFAVAIGAGVWISNGVD